MAPEQRGSIWHEKWTLAFSLVHTQNSILKTKPEYRKYIWGSQAVKGAGGKKKHGAHGHMIKASPPSFTHQGYPPSADIPVN